MTDLPPQSEPETQSQLPDTLAMRDTVLQQMTRRHWSVYEVAERAEVPLWEMIAYLRRYRPLSTQQLDAVTTLLENESSKYLGEQQQSHKTKHTAKRAYTPRGPKDPEEMLYRSKAFTSALKSILFTRDISTKELATDTTLFTEISLKVYLTSGQGSITIPKEIMRVLNIGSAQEVLEAGKLGREQIYQAILTIFDARKPVEMAIAKEAGIERSQLSHYRKYGSGLSGTRLLAVARALGAQDFKELCAAADAITAIDAAPVPSATTAPYSASEKRQIIERLADCGERSELPVGQQHQLAQLRRRLIDAYDISPGTVVQVKTELHQFYDEAYPTGFLPNGLTTEQAAGTDGRKIKAAHAEFDPTHPRSIR